MRIRLRALTWMPLLDTGDNPLYATTILQEKPKRYKLRVLVTAAFAPPVGGWYYASIISP